MEQIPISLLRLLNTLRFGEDEEILSLAAFPNVEIAVLQ
jgi:hypothetical protein